MKQNKTIISSKDLAGIQPSVHPSSVRQEIQAGKKNIYSVQACSVETTPEHLCACGLLAFEEVLYFPGKCKLRRFRCLCVLQITFDLSREFWAVSGPRKEADIST